MAVKAQLDPPLSAVLRPFERMRRRRNEIEYPDFVDTPITAADVLEEATAAESLVTMVRKLYDEMTAFWQ